MATKFQPKSTPANVDKSVEFSFSSEDPVTLDHVIYVSNVDLSKSGNTKKVTCRVEEGNLPEAKKSPVRYQIFLDPAAPDPVVGTKIVGAKLVPAQRPVEGRDGEFEDIEPSWGEPKVRDDGTTTPSLYYVACYLVGRTAIQKPTGGRAMGAALLTL